LLGSSETTERWIAIVRKKNNKSKKEKSFWNSSCLNYRLASTRTSVRDASIWTLPKRGSKRAYSASDSRGSTLVMGPCRHGRRPLNVVCAASRFPHASHVQHSIYFWNIQVQQLQHRKEDRWNT
jgi:hypothetical protein